MGESKKWALSDVFVECVKIDNIREDIIYLKTENRHIGQRIKHLDICISAYKNEIQNNRCNHSIYREFYKKVNSNMNLRMLLLKLQISNSKLIRKHRAKLKELRHNLDELSKGVSDDYIYCSTL